MQSDDTSNDSDSWVSKSQTTGNPAKKYKEDFEQTKSPGEYVGVRLSCMTMFDLCMDVASMDEFCKWSEVTHLIVTCLGVGDGKPDLLDVHGRCLESAGTYMPFFAILKAKYPHIRLVLSFDTVYNSAMKEALNQDAYTFISLLGKILIIYGFHGVELDLTLFIDATACGIECVIRQSVLFGRLYLTVGGGADLHKPRHMALLNLYSMFACSVIVNTFGYFQYQNLYLKQGMIQLLQPLSDRTVTTVQGILMKVLSGINPAKIMLGFSNEAIVFKCEGSVTKDVYETSQKEIALLQYDDEKFLNLRKEGTILAHDNHNDRLRKLELVKRFHLGGIICGDLWNDLTPNATMSFLSFALRNL